MPAVSPGLGATVARFEAALACEQRPLEAIAQLGEPRFLGLLFAIVVRRLVRMGPAAEAASGFGPARLLGLAQRAAAAGVIGVETAVEARRLLLRAEDVLRSAGAWRAERACWWEPLPAVDGLEGVWSRLDAALEDSSRFPRPQRFAEAFAVAPSAPGWLAIPEVLPLALFSDLYRELESAREQGWLELESGTVGRGRISASRSDGVCFLDGLAGDLLDRLPRLAVLVQWCLDRLVARLAEALPGRVLHPPRAAMLARYPAPSGGYEAHFDNPGGAADNGRELALLVYLNGPDARCAGGELALWDAGATGGSPPSVVLPPVGGSVALFDSRSTLHQVRPLRAGPPRWSLAIWLNRTRQGDPVPPPLPEPSLTDLLLTVDSPPVRRGRVAWHELDAVDSAGTIVVRRAKPGRARAGIVATVYAAGADLESWCRHHLAIGFSHLVVVFDRLDEAPEAETAGRLRAAFPPSALTIWSGGELAERGWRGLAVERGLDELVGIARQGYSAQAVASRQALNATVALAASRTGELGAAPLDWLLHLDADELFWPAGPGRGGEEVGEHFASLSEAGFGRVSYLNHELLLPRRAGEAQRFKRNPREARARLGTAGWDRLVEDLGMAQTAPRPYFNGYLNGKSAVATEAGLAAAGVHGWRVAASARACCLAGPAVLHFHFASADAYCRKTLRMAESGATESAVPFTPCRTELAGLELVRSLRGAGTDEEAIRSRLLDLHAGLTRFTDEEAEILAVAGLLLEPGREHGRHVPSLAGGRRPRR